MYVRSRRLERWFARHPNVTIAFLAVLTLAAGLVVGAAAVALSYHAGFVFPIALWLVPAAVIGRRIRKSDPQLADELVERSHDVLGR